jgi:hypothetical protein
VAVATGARVDVVVVVGPLLLVVVVAATGKERPTVVEIGHRGHRAGSNGKYACYLLSLEVESQVLSDLTMSH